MGERVSLCWGWVMLVVVIVGGGDLGLGRLIESRLRLARRTIVGNNKNGSNSTPPPNNRAYCYIVMAAPRKEKHAAGRTCDGGRNTPATWVCLICESVFWSYGFRVSL